jgi:ArsR family transcriptional regulator
VVVDFAPHDLEYLRIQHAHRRLGFSDRELELWFRTAGLEVEGTETLTGNPLTVKIWRGRKAGAATAKPHERASSGSASR